VGELESSDSVGLMVIHKTENAKKNSVWLVLWTTSESYRLCVHSQGVSCSFTLTFKNKHKHTR
jgi:anti-anti-sigma regulatory factor